jgi:CRISPR/Cas system-associated endoribonuclease Cas2
VGAELGLRGRGERGRPQKIQLDLSQIISPGSDSVLFYCIGNPKGWEKRVMGRERATTDTFL